MGPFPGLTRSDRKTPAAGLEMKNDAVQKYKWKDMTWSHSELSKMILLWPKYRGQFDDDDMDENGTLPWLRATDIPTTAIAIAYRHLAKKTPVKHGTVDFEEGFVAHYCLPTFVFGMLLATFICCT